MILPDPPATARADSPVDDVRRIRERLSREHDGDVERLCEHARAVADGLVVKLGLTRVPAPTGRARAAPPRP